MIRKETKMALDYKAKKWQITFKHQRPKKWKIKLAISR